MIPAPKGQLINNTEHCHHYSIESFGNEEIIEFKKLMIVRKWDFWLTLLEKHPVRTFIQSEAPEIFQKWSIR